MLKGLSGAHVCLDIDNTIADADSVFRKVIWQVTDGRVRLQREDIVHYDYYNCPDSLGQRLHKEEWPIVHDAYAGVLDSVQPMAGAVEGLRQLVEAGAVVHLATARLRNARKATIEWLDRHVGSDHLLHFVPAGQKHRLGMGLRFAAEDHHGQAVAFAEAGIPCFLLDHPWNQLPLVGGVTRVKDWKEILERLAD